MSLNMFSQSKLNFYPILVNGIIISVSDPPDKLLIYL